MLELYFHVQAFSDLRVEFNFDFCMFFKWCICVLIHVLVRILLMNNVHLHVFVINNIYQIIINNNIVHFYSFFRTYSFIYLFSLFFLVHLIHVFNNA